ncbi:MAG: hypothetical protein COY81_02350 [Candidatus Pacebacteria bacterium CG_4_10_14_0_8_um_filter_43_12]|nr:MAG: hypothetical protein COU66_03775 [Candidatus Pacebacteria bacterium CG10_big_fil_rev_8_21_14_0_10_44_11]PIY79488.1 MAG: hypothetical protein COY81_02350 [Candidatus Pacebacteria bacterium CG_4_10_14_0_8_um_filter_43_12]
MPLKIPIEPLFIVWKLKQVGFDGFIVGGAVRDLLIKQTDPNQPAVTDYDLTTNAKPEEIMAVFPEAFYENQFGTVSLTREHLREQANLPTAFVDALSAQQSTIDVSAATKLHSSLSINETAKSSTPNYPPYEITTYRSDGAYADHRRPASVTWGASLKEDLDRRDFTINAMAIELADATLAAVFTSQPVPETISLLAPDYKLIDPHQGQADLAARLIRTVGNPSQRFSEDALRMLRAIRFSVQLGCSIEPQTVAAIADLSDLLGHISGERIRDELLKMLVSHQPKLAIEQLDQTGLLRFVLPELLFTKGVEQSGHHTTDVWTHSLDALESSPSHDPIVQLAILLHDIAKPQTFNKTAEGSITFYNHELVGSRLARDIGFRLKLPKKDVERLFILVRHHMFHYQPEHTDAAIRRFMRKVGLENLNDILDLREADRLGSGARKTSWRLEEMKERMTQQLHQPFDLSNLAINGTDLIKELVIQPGPIIGKILQQLLEEVLENPELNTKEKLLTRSRTLITKS